MVTKWILVVYFMLLCAEQYKQERYTDKTIVLPLRVKNTAPVNSFCILFVGAC